MQRVVILGPGGAGKTELARAVARRTGLPVVHLDVLFWGPNWTPAPRDRALRALREATARDRWVVDGNFLSEDDERFQRADTVVLLDLPRRTCIRRVIQRFVRDRRSGRPDLPEDCREGLDLELLRWIWSYRRVDRPRVLALLAGLGPSVDVRHLRSPSEVRRFLASI